MLSPDIFPGWIALLLAICFALVYALTGLASLLYMEEQFLWFERRLDGLSPTRCLWIWAFWPVVIVLFTASHAIASRGSQNPSA